VTTAAIYCRQSRDPDTTRAAVTRQEEACRQLAEHLGWTVGTVYTDNDLSAYSGKPRPGYTALLAAVEAGTVEALLLYATDRLYRRVTDLESFLKVAEPRRLPVATVAAGQLDLGTDQGRMVARILAATAQGEVERKSDRQRRANDQRAATGIPHWSNRPYGYRRTADGVEVVDEEAAVIREAAERLLAGEQTGAVARDLTARGLRSSKGAEWSVTTLRRVVTAPRNAGLRTHRGAVVHDAAWPAILDADIHARLVALFAEPGRRLAPDNRVRHLLSGIVRCGRCATRMLSYRSAYKVQGYRCPKCYLMRKAQPVEDLVVRTVLARLALPDVRDLLAVDDAGPAALAADLDQVRRRQAELGELFAAGTLSAAALRKADADLRRAEQDLVTRLGGVAVASPVAALTAAMDPAARWEELPLLARRQVIETLIDVTIMPTRPGLAFDPKLVRITWRTE
jgi:site-specific DNA recombinase